MTKTESYDLPQWEADDPVCREDFNRAMANIAAGITAVLPYVVGSYTGTGETQTVTVGFPPVCHYLRTCRLFRDEHRKQTHIYIQRYWRECGFHPHPTDQYRICRRCASDGKFVPRLYYGGKKIRLYCFPVKEAEAHGKSPWALLNGMMRSDHVEITEL